ncbi:putative 3-hydroxyphenylpropionic transporter MhpT [Klebsiella pneumoniae]|nr:putative 3-hydroxyphenylpropionic transporter MhpT [Klebsiella pneumoniae]
MVPLLLIPLLMRWLPESQAFQRAEASVPLRTLFAPGQAAATLLLWLGYFFTLLVVYMLINWLPMLLVGQGFRASQAAGVMFSLQIGAACGTLLLGALMDKLTPLRMSLLIYSGILASLLALGSASSLTGMLLAGFVAGLFRHRRTKCALRSGAAFLSRGHPRHRGGHRRGGGASWGDERPAAGRQDAGPRHRHRRGDGGLGAGHCAGRRGGVLADASPAARGHGLICIRRSGKKMPGRRLACPRPLA